MLCEAICRRDLDRWQIQQSGIAFLKALSDEHDKAICVKHVVLQ